MTVVPLFGLLAAALYMLAARTYVADLKQRRRASSRRSRTDLKPHRPGVTMERQRHIAMNKPAAIAPAPACARASRRRGNWNPDWEPFAKLDPAWTEKVIALAIAPAVAGALDAKTIELIGIALDVSCTHLYAPGVRRHIQRALKAGATQRGDHRRPAAREPARAAQHVRRRADPARGTRSARARNAKARPSAATLTHLKGEHT